MPLTAGTTLGPYEIQAPLGAGGMGEVYKARDTRLDRTVAIKVLPEHVASDPDLQQRFEREAKTISSLNHPHICTLHDIGNQDGIDFLVMEYLEGDTLAQRMKKGALRLDQALKVAIEIADALDKAHRQGITHRDLKPGNIMLTKAGAKLLDFGLAKLRKPGTLGAEGFSAATTASEPQTAGGTLLGTLPYMTPEQLEGKDADARTDLFAFGAVVYEMVTGTRAFEGETQASLITAIMSSDPPPASTHQPLTPAALDRVVMKCLSKDPDKRWQTATDLGDELAWIAESRSRTEPALEQATGRPGWGQPLALVLVTTVVAAVVASFVVWTRTGPEPRMPTRFTVSMPATAGIIGRPALSADGRTLVYFVADRDTVRLYRRSFDQVESTVVPGFDDFSAIDPFFSPDGSEIGFFARTRQGVTTLRRMPLEGGPPVTLWEGVLAQSATWGASDTIVVGEQGPHGDERASLWQVSARGGEPRPLTTVDLENDEVAHFRPSFLPGGNALLFEVEMGEDEPGTSQIAVLSIVSGERRMLLQGSHPQYASPGHIVFVRGTSLWRVAFDADRLAVTGDPVPISEPVLILGPSESAMLAVSRDGSLAYVPAGADTELQRTLVWVDEQGREEPLDFPAGPYISVRSFPSGSYMLPLSGSYTDVWIGDVARGTLTKITTDPALDGVGIATPDGERVVFRSDRAGTPGLYSKAADGTGDVERLMTHDSAYVLVPDSWSPDGKMLTFSYNTPETKFDVGILSMGGDRSWRPLLATAADESNSVISPDGRWIAYHGDETGQPEVYVQRFPDLGQRRQISTDGGFDPLWSPDGTKLYYLESTGPVRMVAVDVSTDPELTVGDAEVLFEGPYFRTILVGGRRHDIASDGRFLMIRDDESEDASSAEGIVVVQHWADGLHDDAPNP